MPSEQLIPAMAKFHEELAAAGALLKCGRRLSRMILNRAMR